MKTVKAKSKHDLYVKKLQRKFNVVVNCETWIGHNVPVGHTCAACNSTFRASPRRMLAQAKTSPHCILCARRAAIPESKVPQKKFELKLNKKFYHIRLVKWTSMHRNSEFGCECGATWLAKPKDVIKDKANPCPECTALQSRARESYGIGEINMLLSVRQPALVVHAPAANSSYSVACSNCKSLWNTVLQVLLGSTVACPVCNSLNRLGPESREIHLSIIECAARLTKVNVATVRSLAHTPNAVQSYRYVYKGIAATYTPYCAVGAELFEVSNSRSLKLEGDWDICKARAKAAQRAGAVAHMLYLVGTEVHVMPSEWLRWNSVQVQAWSRKFELQELVVLSMDPGVTNFAWSVLKAKRGGRVDVVATGMLRHTLKELTGNSRENTDAFCAEIQELLEEYRVSHMIMERFMSRGMKGLTIELVNTMIGILMGMWNGESASFKLVTAAQWKNEWNRRSDLKAFYKTVNCEVHQADAIGIGIYGAAYWFDEEPFATITKLERKLVKQIAAANIETKARV